MSPPCIPTSACPCPAVLPIRILAQGRDDVRAILDHYGLTPEWLREVGGTMTTDRNDLDVIIHNAGPSNAPEYNFWPEVAQKHDLRFVGLPLHPGAARYYRERGYMK